MALSICSRRSLPPLKTSKWTDSPGSDTALVYGSLRSLSPHKKSKRMDSPELRTAPGYRPLRLLSPYKKSKRMDASKFQVVLSDEDEDSYGPDLTANIQNAVAAEVKREISRRGLSNLASQLGTLKDRVVEVKQRLDKHQKGLDLMADITEKLQEANRTNESSIDEIISKLEKIAQNGRNHEQRLSKLEEGALGAGSSNNKPTDTSGSKQRPKRRCCSFCGKELSALYLRKHQKKHCKKAGCCQN